MLKLYCQKCGALNSYVSEKPNFCQKCGKSFGKIIASVGPEIETDEDEPEQDSKFDLEGLEVEIDSGRSSTETIGNIAGSMSEADAKKALNQNVPKGVDTTYTAEDFQKEAGSIRNQNEPEET